MFRCACVVLLAVLAASSAQARHHHAAEPTDVPLTIGGLLFTVPAAWQVQAPQTPARAGEWLVPAAANQPGDGVEIVAFFFGPGVGGSAQENVQAWAATMTASDGSHPATAPEKRMAGGHAVTKIFLTGTYAETMRQPGLPPVSKPDYALLGEVVENPGGTIYWRVTGPAGAVATLAPAIDKMIDGLKPAGAPTAPTP